MIQLISDMEELYRVTGDPDFSLIIVDYDSTDMDVKKALEAASLPQYVPSYDSSSSSSSSSTKLNYHCYSMYPLLYSFSVCVCALCFY